MTTYQYQVPVNNSQDDTQQDPIANRGGSVSVTLSNGEAVTEHRGYAQYNHGNTARDAHGESWKGTARDPRGFSTAEITRDTLVTIGGVQARVQDFVSMGHLREVAPGQFAEYGAEAGEPMQTPAPEAVDDDTPPAAGEVNAFMGDLLSAVPQHAVEPLMNAAAHAVAAGGSMDSVAAQLAAQVPDMTPEQAEMVIGYAVKPLQDQADAYLSAPGRVGSREGLEHFYEYARKDPLKMQQAINQQRNGSMAGWRSLVESYQSTTPPTVRALQAAGLPTRNTSGTPEVYLHGMWMSVHGAARAGLI